MRLMDLDDRTPVLVGAGQVNANFPAAEPVDLLAEAITNGAGSALIGTVDSIQVVAIGTRRYSDPGRLVAGRLGIESVHTVYSTHGGQSPQALISRAACDIWEGRFRTVAIGGAESWRTRQRLKKAGETPDWTVQDPEDHPDEVFGAPLRMGSKLENSLGFGDPLDAYPLLETAIRQRRRPESGRARRSRGPAVARLQRRGAHESFRGDPGADHVDDDEDGRPAEPADQPSLSQAGGGEQQRRPGGRRPDDQRW